MILELKNLFAAPGERMPLDISLDFSDVGYHTGKPFTGPVSLKGEIFNNCGVVRIMADAEYIFDAPCDRCGEDTVLSDEAKVAHVLVHEQNTDSDEFLLVPDMCLDIDDLVLSDILLSLPSKHLCDPDCKGICPECGKNRNTEKCECTSDPFDLRFSKLKELL